MSVNLFETLAMARERQARLHSLDLPEGSPEAEYRDLQGEAVVMLADIVGQPATTEMLEAFEQQAARITGFNKGGRDRDEWMFWYQTYTHDDSWGTWLNVVEGMSAYVDADIDEIKGSEAYKAGMPEALAFVAATAVLAGVRDQIVEVWQSGQADRADIDDYLTPEAHAARNCIDTLYTLLGGDDEDDDGE